MNVKRLLGVFAHPDDETLLAGALLARYAAGGARVGVLCAAPGGDVTRDRLRAACTELGVATVSTLRYSGSPAWPDGSRRDVMGLRLAEVRQDDLAGRIAGQISEFQPDAVLTHSTYGDYGHPDHAAVCSAVIRAMREMQPSSARLFTLSWPDRLVRLNLRMMRLRGADVTRMGPHGDFNLAQAVADAPKRSLSVEVSQWLGIRKAASRVYLEEISRGPLPLRMLERAPVALQRVALGRMGLAEPGVAKSLLR